MQLLEVTDNVIKSSVQNSQTKYCHIHKKVLLDKALDRLANYVTKIRLHID